jgi:cardiolipin synthase
MILLTSTFPAFIKYVFIAIYLLAFVYTIVRILLDTSSTPKTLAYILLVIVLPLVGMFIYFAFGINYRHRKFTQKGVTSHEEFTKAYTDNVPDKTETLVNTYADYLSKYTDLIQFIYNLRVEKLSINDFKLLINGEEKFPEVLKTLKTAEHFIHMEYYDWENDLTLLQLCNMTRLTPDLILRW